MTDGEAAVWDLLIAEFAPSELIVQDALRLRLHVQHRYYVGEI